MLLPGLEQFFLVGGTALALQLGHRFSVDLDLFTTEPFDKAELLEILNQDFTVSVESESKNIFITYINNVKVDFVKVAYPTLYPVLEVEGLRMLQVADIAPMKLSAITGRGSKKDFYDIYFLLRLMPLDDMLRLFLDKFKQHEIFHVHKSLTYFEDAERQDDPMIFEESVSWQNIKDTIREAVKKAS